MFAVTFIVTFATVPLSKRIAKALGAIDYPGNRRINTEPIPRCGGIALFLGLHAAALTVAIGMRFFGWQLTDLYVVPGVDYLIAYVGIVFVFAVGLVDDITQLSPWAKFGGQLAAAIIVVYSGVSIGVVLMPITGELIDLGWANYPLSVIFLVAYVNIINLIDGLDGLAAGIVAIMSGCLLYLMIIRGNMTLAFICIALVAVCLAFLRYNFFPATVFMGDSGALLLGMMMGIVAIAGITRAQSLVLMVAPIAIAGVPALDTLSAIVRRLRGHQSIGEADTNHIHHRLMRSKLGQKGSVLLLWLCSALLAVVSIVIVMFSGPVRWALFCILVVVVFLIIWQFGLFSPVLKHHYDNRGHTGPRMPRNVGSAEGAGWGAADGDGLPAGEDAAVVDEAAAIGDADAAGGVQVVSASAAGAAVGAADATAAAPVMQDGE